MTVSATQLEALVVRLVADQGDSARVVDDFERKVVNATSTAQGAADEYTRHIARAREVTMAVASPMEKFELQVEELDDLMRLGIITQQTYNRNFDRLKNELDQATPQVNKMTAALANMEKMANVGYKMMFAITAPVVLLGRSALKSASDAEEGLNKFNVIFGTVQDQAAAAVDLLDQKYGQTNTSAKALLATTGDLLKGFGFSAAAALEYSTEVQKLAVDVASFSNVEGGAKRVSEALTKAMLGEREMLKEMGIAILEEDVKLKVAQLTKEGMTFATERQAKAYATLAIAVEQSQHRIGDFAATESSFANQTRMLTDEFWELVQLFGQELVPVALTLVKDILRPMIDYFADLSPQVKQVILVVMGLAAAIGPVLVVMASLAGAVNSLIAVWPTLVAAWTASKVALGGLATGAGAAKLGLVALGTYLAYEGLKEVLGYNAAIKELKANVEQLQGTERIMKAMLDKKADKAIDDAVGIKDLDKRAAALDALKTKESNMARDYAGQITNLIKLRDQMADKGEVTDDIDATIKQYQDRWETAKARIQRIEEEINATKAAKDQLPGQALGEDVAAYAHQANNMLGNMLTGLDRAARGGPTPEEKEMVGGAAKAVADYFSDAVKNRLTTKTVDWLGGMFEKKEQLGMIQDQLADITDLAGRDYTLNFKADGLDAIEVNSMDFLAKWQAQSLKVTQDVTAFQEAPEEAAVGASFAAATMLGGGLAGIGMGLGMAEAGLPTPADLATGKPFPTLAQTAPGANVAGDKGKGVEQEQRENRKVNALEKLANTAGAVVMRIADRI